jgi:hypothetical protein
VEVHGLRCHRDGEQLKCSSYSRARPHMCPGLLEQFVIGPELFIFYCFLPADFVLCHSRHQVAHGESSRRCFYDEDLNPFESIDVVMIMLPDQARFNFLSLKRDPGDSRDNMGVEDWTGVT